MKTKIIRIITLHQPYAILLAYGIKMNETRPKATSHTAEKGIYLIHAAKKWTKEQNDLCLKEPFLSELKKIFPYPIEKELVGKYGSVLNYEEGQLEFVLPLGQIIGSFEVKKCGTVVGFDTPMAKDNTICLNEIGSKTIIQLDNNNEIEIDINSNEHKFGDYSLNRSIWIGQNHRVLKNPIPYKGQQGYYNTFKGDINQLKFL